MRLAVTPRQYCQRVSVNSSAGPRAARYVTELDSLDRAIAAGRSASIDLARALREVADRSVQFVGSGGALASALLARDLQIHATNRIASATTPLLTAQAPRILGSAMVVFSTSGKNPDVAAALSAARRAELDPLILVTGRRKEQLPTRVTRHDPRIVRVESPSDGFLATGSVVAVAAAIATAHGHQLPDARHLVGAATDDLTVLGPRLLVLYGWGHECVARDIETRISELGIGTVELTDYRNFAHGRHVGLWRNLESTSVLALVDPATEGIASKTLAQLPEGAKITSLRSGAEWPASAVELLIRALRIPLGLDPGDPAKPKVAPFGRKLYNLPIAKTLNASPVGPVERKRAAGGNSYGQEQTSQALERWLSQAAQDAIGGVVLDYDGTCCTTAGRFEPPDAAVRDAILRVIDLGVRVAFASGRGKSLPSGLRSWIPEGHWSSIRLGLYNGSVLMRLDEELADQASAPADFVSLADELRSALPDTVDIDIRSSQVSVRSTSGLPGRALLPIVESTLARGGRRALKAFASGHSVDITDARHSKAEVIRVVEEELSHESSVLSIGDSGALVGNDSELLAARTLSLSVNEVSPDLTRCWNLDARGEQGPALLRRYLASLRRDGDTVRFSWNAHA